jgi:hypothetical protein
MDAETLNAFTKAEKIYSCEKMFVNDSLNPTEVLTLLLNTFYETDFIETGSGTLKH